MASIKRGSSFNASIWPGFVDAMTALLLVLMFVLTIFMIVQFTLRETITTQDTQLHYLSAQVASLAEALGLEEQKSQGLEGEVDRLGGELTDANSAAELQAQLIATLTQQAKNQNDRIAAFEAQVTSFEAQVATLLSERDQLRIEQAALSDDLAAAEGQNTAMAARISEAEAANLRIMSEKEALQLALAKARDEIDQSVEEARLAAAKREALEALIAETQKNIAERDTSLQAALAALSETKTALGSTKEDLENQLARMAADLAASRAAHAGEAKTAAELQARLDVLEKGLSDSEKDRLAVEAAAAQLRAELEASKQTLTEEEKSRLAEAAAAEALRQRLANAETQLSDEEKSRLAEAAAAEALREKLKNAQTELTAMTLALEEKRKEAENTLTLLAAAEASRKDLDLSLAEALIGKDRAENDRRTARQKITALEDDRKNLTARLAAVVAQLEATGSESGKLLADADAKRSELEARLAAALAAKIAAENQIDDTLSKSEQQRILLAKANEELSDEKAKSAETQREMALLNQQTAVLRKQLASLQGLLDDAKAREADAQVQISSLGADLNIALAQKVAEEKRRAELEEAERKRLEVEARNLERFKSEFFGLMRDVLGNREGVKIVGDRFVFASEVLFPAGSAEMSNAGQGEIAKVAALINEVRDKIPPEIDWILRVDGHTDNVPLTGTGQFKDNWELSQARALSVVRYMIDDLGIPANRLAATGFGEFQPINSGDSREARAQNRRIELKFTER
jgi:chemotaxis protein MotB